MKEKLNKHEGVKVKNSDTIAERNSYQITRVFEQHETRILNNIQRLNSMNNKMVDIKVKIVQNGGNIVENSSIISDVKSGAERNSAQITSVSEKVEKRSSRQ